MIGNHITTVTVVAGASMHRGGAGVEVAASDRAREVPFPPMDTIQSKRVLFRVSFRRPNQGTEPRPQAYYFIGDPGRIRTCNLPLRRGLLYPVEPRGHGFGLAQNGVVIQPHCTVVWQRCGGGLDMVIACARPTHYAVDRIPLSSRTSAFDTASETPVDPS